jgi:hypothetical protein
LRLHHRECPDSQHDGLIAFVHDRVAQGNTGSLSGGKNPKRLADTLRTFLNAFNYHFSREITVTPRRRTIVGMVAKHCVLRREPEAVSTPNAPVLLSGRTELIVECFQDVFAEWCFVNENTRADIRCNEQLEIVIREPQSVAPTAVRDDFRS